MCEIHGPRAFGTIKPDGEARCFSDDPRSDGHVCRQSWQPMIET